MEYISCLNKNTALNVQNPEKQGGVANKIHYTKAIKYKKE